MRIDRRYMPRALKGLYDLLEGQHNPLRDAIGSGTGVSLVDVSGGGMHRIEITFKNTPIVMADNAGVIAFGSLLVATLPKGNNYFLGAGGKLTLTKSSAGILDTFRATLGLGTVAADNSNTLATTEQNIIPTTAATQAVAGSAPWSKATTVVGPIIDGNTTANKLYLNALINDADHDVTTTPANLIVNGKITVMVADMGETA